jgi:hypothetical protein
VETWLITALSAEWASRGFDRCVVAYSRLLKDPGVEMARLRAHYAHPTLSPADGEDAEQWLRSLTDRSHATWDAIGAWAPLNDLADRVYWELLHTATEPTGGTIDPGHLATLDELAEVYVAFTSRWKFESVRPGALSLPRLTWGDRGPDVARLQALLAAAGYEIGVTGDFDIETAGAVRDFKERHGLFVNDVCGRSCWIALMGAR